MKRLPDQPPLTKRADYNPAKKVKRPIASAGAKSARTPASLRGDMDYMYEPVDAMTQRAAQDNFCVVCERVIASGCDAEHIESHVKELWDSLELSEKEVSFSILFVHFTFCFVYVRFWWKVVTLIVNLENSNEGCD